MKLTITFGQNSARSVFSLRFHHTLGTHSNIFGTLGQNKKLFAVSFCLMSQWVYKNFTTLFLLVLKPYSQSNLAFGGTAPALFQFHRCFPWCKSYANLQSRWVGLTFIALWYGFGSRWLRILRKLTYGMWDIYDLDCWNGMGNSFAWSEGQWLLAVHIFRFCIPSQTKGCLSMWFKFFCWPKSSGLKIFTIFLVRSNSFGCF